MNDPQTSMSLVAAWILWGLTAVAMACSVVSALMGHWEAAAIFGFLSGVLAPAAAVAHVRFYLARLARMIRGLYGIESSVTPSRR